MEQAKVRQTITNASKWKAERSKIILFFIILRWLDIIKVISVIFVIVLIYICVIICSNSTY
jgi:hypothetical protein